MPKRIFFTVTNNLVYDQRMHRICTSMANAGYLITLVGREMPNSPPLKTCAYKQVRIPLKHQKGKRFYLEYNYKLYRYLSRQNMDAICAIDLDTIIPVYMVSQKLGIPRMYDAHEFFTEMIEVKRRAHIHFVWKRVESGLVPKFKHGYTVGQAIAGELKKLYGVDYALVRNMPWYSEPSSMNSTLPHFAAQILEQFDRQTDPNLPFILYQGAVNEGRALPQLVKAMKELPARLLIAGSGNLENEIRNLVDQGGLNQKIFMCGDVPPADLKVITSCCFAGITIFDAFSKNQYFSLGNKFFDYIMARKPQVCVNYPEYKAILKQFPVAVPLENTKPASIVQSLNKLLNDPVLYENLEKECAVASKVLNWETEEKTLLQCWQHLFDEMG